MSPDEGLRAAAERLATVADSLYHFPDQPRTEDDKRAIAAVINALAASGEGGSTSALRASAPEGIDALCRQHVEAACDGSIITIPHPTDPTDTAKGCTLAPEYINGQAVRRVLAALADAPPQADAKAIPSPAPQAPSPEGIDALDRLAAIIDGDAFDGPGNELTVERAERRNAAREKVRLIENALVAAGWQTNTDAARAAKSAQSRGANAPSLPEGFIDPATVRIVNDAKGKWLSWEAHYEDRAVAGEGHATIFAAGYGANEAAARESLNAVLAGIFKRPEGITAQAMVADAIDGELRRQIADLQATIKHERHQHAVAAEKHAAEYHRIATALGCHVHDDLVAKCDAAIACAEAAEKDAASAHRCWANERTRAAEAEAKLSVVQAERDKERIYRNLDANTIARLKEQFTSAEAAALRMFEVLSSLVDLMALEESRPGSGPNGCEWSIHTRSLIADKIRAAISPQGASDGR